MRCGFDERITGRCSWSFVAIVSSMIFLKISSPANGPTPPTIPIILFNLTLIRFKNICLALMPGRQLLFSLKSYQKLVAVASGDNVSTFLQIVIQKRDSAEAPTE